jgi:hypothetical protein
MEPSAIPFQMNPKALLLSFIVFTLFILAVDRAISSDHLHHWKQMCIDYIRQRLLTPIRGKPDGGRNNVANQTDGDVNTAEDEDLANSIASVAKTAANTPLAAEEAGVLPLAREETLVNE